MKYKQLGKSDLHISTVGFGCMSLSDDHPANERLLHKAVELGINFFDTADLYQKGWNEESVGRALKAKRNNLVIATKAGNQWRPDGSGWDWNPNKDYILQCAEKSLQRLQTDYIDLYQLHGGTINDPIDDTIAAFEQLKKEGKIRYYGISSIRPNVIREYIQRSNIVSVMIQYSLLDRRPEETCLPLLQEHNIGVLARGPLAQGLLVNKPPKEYLGYSAQQVQTLQEKLSKHSAMRYVLQNPAITAAIPGIRTLQHLADAVEAVDAPDINTAELASVLPANTYEQHR
jgi:Predicted oxidoreductases (related to aryl-alcohol dehydrogenases)